MQGRRVGELLVSKYSSTTGMYEVQVRVQLLVIGQAQPENLFALAIIRKANLEPQRAQMYRYGVWKTTPQ
jgi:hypothetical protein